MQRYVQRNTVLAGLVIAGVILAFSMQAETAPNKPERNKQALRAFMRTKLDASQKVLEGLCTEDYELIGKGADALKKIGVSEEWRISNDPTYSQRSAEFSRVAERLKKTADEKKIDGVALTWMEATMSCIECHRWVRTELIAKGQQPAETQLTDLNAIDARLLNTFPKDR